MPKEEDNQPKQTQDEEINIFELLRETPQEKQFLRKIGIINEQSGDSAEQPTRKS